MSSKKIQVRLSIDDATHRRLKAKAALGGVTLAELLERILKEHVDKEQ